MGHIQVVALNVTGDAAVLSEVIRVASNFLNQSAAPFAAPVGATLEELPPPAAPNGDALDLGKLAAHTRAEHPKHKTAPVESKKAEVAGASLWCPVKNCGRSFGKKGWLNNHLERDHGVANPV